MILLATLEPEKCLQRSSQQSEHLQNQNVFNSTLMKTNERTTLSIPTLPDYINSIAKHPIMQN